MHRFFDLMHAVHDLRRLACPADVIELRTTQSREGSRCVLCNGEMAHQICSLPKKCKTPTLWGRSSCRSRLRVSDASTADTIS